MAPEALGSRKPARRAAVRARCRRPAGECDSPSGLHGAAGRGVQNMCSSCRGDGRVRRVDTIEVRIPAGVQTGSRVRVAGRGNAGTNGAPPGDLYIITDVKPHPFFDRRGDDIYTTVPVTVTRSGAGRKDRSAHCGTGVCCCVFLPGRTAAAEVAPSARRAFRR